jgi:hypothetical protein
LCFCGIGIETDHNPKMLEKEMIDAIAPIHYEDLAKMDPEDVCRRALCDYDQEAQCYELMVWGDVYQVYPQDGKVRCMSEKDHPANSYFPIFIVHYLLTIGEAEIENQWISEKDIPGGSAFFRGPHAVPTEQVTNRFLNDIEAFNRRCTNLSGKPIDMGDAAFRFEITARIPVVMLYWQGDEDFGPEARILFDRSMCKYLALDVIYALVVEMCTRIGGKS